MAENSNIEWTTPTKAEKSAATKCGCTVEQWIARRSAGELWCGITAENHIEYDRRMAYLRDVPAAVRFVSYEPALGYIDLTATDYFPDWIICGGEDRARPGRPSNAEFLRWAYSLRDQCLIRSIPFFFKQTVGKGEIPADLMIRQFPHRP